MCVQLRERICEGVHGGRRERGEARRLCRDTGVHRESGAAGEVDGNRLRLDRFDESDFTPPQLTRQSSNHPWVLVKDAPEPLKAYYLGDWEKQGRTHKATPEMLRTLEEMALERHLAIKSDTLMQRLRDTAEAVYKRDGTDEARGLWGESRNVYKDQHAYMGVAAEKFGESVAEHHCIAAEHPSAVRQPLSGPRNGNDQFDQVWKDGDRWGPGTRRAESGSRRGPGSTSWTSSTRCASAARTNPTSSCSRRSWKPLSPTEGSTMSWSRERRTLAHTLAIV